MRSITLLQEIMDLSRIYDLALDLIKEQNWQDVTLPKVEKLIEQAEFFIKNCNEKWETKDFPMNDEIFFPHVRRMGHHAAEMNDLFLHLKGTNQEVVEYLNDIAGIMCTEWEKWLEFLNETVEKLEDDNEQKEIKSKLEQQMKPFLNHGKSSFSKFRYDADIEKNRDIFKFHFLPEEANKYSQKYESMTISFKKKKKA